MLWKIEFNELLFSDNASLGVNTKNRLFFPHNMVIFIISAGFSAKMVGNFHWMIDILLAQIVILVYTMLRIKLI